MGYRILMLSDHPDHLAAFTDLAQKAGHQVLALHSVRESMNWLNAKDHVDVIVCHAFLESESVFEFLKAVKHDPRHDWVQFIVLSCGQSELTKFLDPTVKDAAHILGADKYINMREFNPDRLLKEVEASFPEMPPQKDQDPIRDAISIPRPVDDVPENVDEAQRKK